MSPLVLLVRKVDGICFHVVIDEYLSVLFCVFVSFSNGISSTIRIPRLWWLPCYEIFFSGKKCVSLYQF